MTHLILTTDDSGAGALRGAGIADIVIPFGLRFVWGPLRSDAELASFLAERPANSGSHWLDNIDPRRLGEFGNEIGLIDLFERCETIDLWIDPGPNAQLILIWLLDYLRPYQHITSKLRLVQADVPIGNQLSTELVEWRIPAVKIQNDHTQTAGAAWRAYRAPTPQDWFNLLSSDLSVLPKFRQAAVILLEELPTAATGLGATEMQMLELISEGNAGPFDVFPGHEKRNERRAFGYWEVGSLLDGLAQCPVPVVTGLREGPFTLEMHDDRSRHERYTRSRLSLTELGKAVLAGRDDFTRHNPIHRWWGGTELTNDRLWRWDPANRALITPSAG
jgi:hypothetical protein